MTDGVRAGLDRPPLADDYRSSTGDIGQLEGADAAVSSVPALYRRRAGDISTGVPAGVSGGQRAQYRPDVSAVYVLADR